MNSKKPRKPRKTERRGPLQQPPGRRGHETIRVFWGTLVDIHRDERLIADRLHRFRTRLANSMLNSEKVRLTKQIEAEEAELSTLAQIKRGATLELQRALQEFNAQRIQHGEKPLLTTNELLQFMEELQE